MVVVHPQFNTSEEQQRQMVMLTIDEWKQVVEELEELDDIRIYDETKRIHQESIDFEQAIQEIEGHGA